MNISPTEYSNLVYSCRSCNNSKRAKWPTGDENVHNDGEQGFIDLAMMLMQHNLRDWQMALSTQLLILVIGCGLHLILEILLTE